jgi:hypothetical protein
VVGGREGRGHLPVILPGELHPAGELEGAGGEVQIQRSHRQAHVDQGSALRLPIVVLKVLTNEKRGSFERSRFKLIMLRYSRKSAQTPSCRRP